MTQPQHLHEQALKRGPVTAREPRDRRVVGPVVPAQHPERDIQDAAALDLARGPHAHRVRMQQHRHHQRRIERRPTLTIRPVHPVERAQIQLADHRQHQPRQLTLTKPVPNIRRQQERLIDISPDKVLRHTP